MDGYAPTDLVLPEGLTEDDIGLPLSDCNDSDPNGYLRNIEVLSDTVSDGIVMVIDTFLILESETISANTDGPSLPLPFVWPQTTALHLCHLLLKILNSMPFRGNHSHIL